MKYSLFDLDHGREAIRKDRVLLAGAWISVVGGSVRQSPDTYHRLIRRLWKYDDCPLLSEYKKIGIKEVKDCIKNRISCVDGIWNSDFLMGMVRGGKLKTYKWRFPSLYFNENQNMSDLIKTSTFGGKYKEYVCRYSGKKCGWSGVPALCLSYKDSTISYLAGFLAIGKFFIKDAYTYILYDLKHEEYLKSIGVPIECKIKFRKNSYLLISPIWPALLSYKMPEKFRDRWLEVKNPYGAEDYAAVLWKTYVSNNFHPKALPWLKCRRSIFYEYKSEEGAMTKLERRRVGKGLTELHNNFRESVKWWANNYEEKNKNSKNVETGSQTLVESSL